MTARIDALELDAPDVVAAWRGVEESRLDGVRHEIRDRAGDGSANGIVRQLAAIAHEMTGAIASLPDGAFVMPGGEEDWNVAQAFGHAADARAGLAMAAALAAGGRWPAHAPRVVPGVPGIPTSTREQLVRRIDVSQRIVERAARTIAGHETDTCPLDHPLVGTLRCGEWLLFAGVHDLMHLDQLEALEATIR